MVLKLIAAIPVRSNISRLDTVCQLACISLIRRIPIATRVLKQRTRLIQKPKVYAPGIDAETIDLTVCRIFAGGKSQFELLDQKCCVPMMRPVFFDHRIFETVQFGRMRSARRQSVPR